MVKNRFPRSFAAAAFFGICIWLAPVLGNGQEANLTIQLKAISSSKGSVMLALFKEPEGFPFATQRAFKLEKLPAKAGEVQVSFAKLPTGRYALAVFHDENGDSKLNTNSLGIPREGYGFSNNVRPKFSAPKFHQAAFDLTDDARLTVNVKY
jgi:uncharacterized protein (DUF2141 family)